MKSIKDVVVVWNRESDDVVIQDFVFYSNNPRNHKFSWGACNSEIATENNFQKRQLLCFINAYVLIIRDKCDKDAVQKAFSQIEEFADGLPDDALNI